jgi:hypothetical protein
MSELDTLANQLEALLEGVKTKFTLAEWRYASRKVIYSMGLEILEKFPDIVIGQPPIPQKGPPQAMRMSSPGGPAASGDPGVHPIIDDQQPPYRPSAVGTLVCLVLGDCPEQH